MVALRAISSPFADYLHAIGRCELARLRRRAGGSVPQRWARLGRLGLGAVLGCGGAVDGRALLRACARLLEQYPRELIQRIAQVERQPLKVRQGVARADQAEVQCPRVADA